MYRALSPSEVAIHGQIAQRYCDREAISAFLADIYGKEDEVAYVRIEVDQTKYGPSILAVHVLDSEYNELLPDLTLPFWQETLEQVDLFCEGDDKETVLDEVYSHLRNSSAIYLEYGLPTDDEDEIDVRLPMMIPQTLLYVKEGKD